MSDFSFDCHLMNAIYLSELWSYEDLKGFKERNPSLWSHQLEEQLNDEMRHYKMCLRALKEEDFNIVHDLKFSMQERLYTKFVQLRPTNSLATLASIHHVFERRAIWVFKTYQQAISNDKFKRIFKNLLKDELVHTNHLSFLLSKKEIDNVKQADKELWQKFLPGKFGPSGLSGFQLWAWYYNPNSN